MRVLSRRVVEISDDPSASYELTLELSRSEPGPPAPPLYGILYVGFGPRQTEYGADILYYANPGDTPGPGFEYRPTTGLLTPLQDATPPGGNGSWYAWRIDGDGTVDVVCHITGYGILLGGSSTWTLAINLNGTPVADAEATFTSDGLLGQGWDPTVTITDLAVTNGDLITATLIATDPQPAFFRAVRGAGQGGERLEITGGDLS
jgi:hypothetical protein